MIHYPQSVIAAVRLFLGMQPLGDLPLDSFNIVLWRDRCQSRGFRSRKIR